MISTKTEKYFSGIRTRNMLEPEIIYNKAPNIRSVNKKLEMDYSLFLNKPFLMKTLTWSTSQNQFDLLGNLNLPTEIFSNTFLSVPFTHSAMFRCKARAMVQVSGTPLHQGIVLVSSTPVTRNNLNGRLNVNHHMNAPHVFLAANSATSAALELPFYCNTKLLRCDKNSSDQLFLSDASGNTFNSLLFFIMNPLVAPTSGSTSVTITVHIIFDELEFFVPWSDVEWEAQCNCRDMTCWSECVTDLKIPPVPEFEAQMDQMPPWPYASWNDVPRQQSNLNPHAVSFQPQVISPQPAATPAAVVVDPPEPEKSAWDRFTGLISSTFDRIAGGAKKVTGDLIDIGRAAVREYTGLHNGNNGRLQEREYVQSRCHMNTVDSETTHEKLDPYVNYERITRDYNFNTDKDEMSISSLLAKPQYLSTFSVNVSESSGTMKFSRPITPVQEILLDANSTPYMTTNQQVLAYFSRYWKGSIKLHIQADMTNFHYCKLAVFRNYSPHKQQLTKVPSYASIQGLTIEFLEFSSGGQVQTIDLPYCSLMNNLECSRDWSYNAMEHGMYYIYLVQPLIVSGTVSTSVSFNVYYSMGDDFQLFGYATDPAIVADGDSFTSGAVARKRVKKKKLPGQTPADELMGHVATGLQQELDGFLAQGTTIPAQDDQDMELRKKVHESVKDSETHRPLTNIRDLVRRLGALQPISLSAATLIATKGVTQLVVSDLIGVPNISNSDLSSPLQCLRRLYLGMEGGLKFKFKITGAANASISYIPPGTYVGTSTTLVAYGTQVHSNSDNMTNEQEDAFNYVGQVTGNPVPQQEAANYAREFPGQHFNNNGTTGTASSYSSSEVILDIVIPNLNPCRFLGDGDVYEAGLSAGVSVSNDMGTIIISTKLNPTGSPLTFHPVLIQPYMALSDESRLGFQIKSTTLQYPTIEDDLADVRLRTVFNADYGGDVGTPANPLSAAPSCYYG
jgi:hypothetical protein